MVIRPRYAVSLIFAITLSSCFCKNSLSQLHAENTKPEILDESQKNAFKLTITAEGKFNYYNELPMAIKSTLPKNKIFPPKRRYPNA
ncbi:MAG: hypothetical protein HQK54_12600 [Oligoflexales bacterium]|nr:hypothetical protein [Oligoflexales bacterium]